MSKAMNGKRPFIRAVELGVPAFEVESETQTQAMLDSIVSPLKHVVFRPALVRSLRDKLMIARKRVVLYPPRYLGEVTLGSYEHRMALYEREACALAFATIRRLFAKHVRCCFVAVFARRSPLDCLTCSCAFAFVSACAWCCRVCVARCAFLTHSIKCVRRRVGPGTQPLAPSRITHVLTCSCTGAFAPGLQDR